MFSNFGVTEIYEIGHDDNRDYRLYQPTIPIDTAADLPVDRSLVVLASQDAKYVRGNESLVEFVHPDNAIYLFGGSHLNLNDDQCLGGATPDHLVFIPSVKYEMYSHAAAYITLYDRLVKNG